ncbi:hypothetical protein [Parapedobacter koreensis]|uniref:Uncharacterized protein n=1 Tax=Parapedobacter koreensis TaxID=332977 RepID=A0A1H7UF83_9SPHI|nr:hypothetical protein [Parapedobacter koreensis]SEL95456.1 hypothetical protein SAMN05421740_11527 [Parapedobacter koreensis]
MSNMILKNIVYVILTGFWLYSCHGKVENEQQITNEDSVETSGIDSSENIIQESTMYPYRKVDSLIQLLEKKYDDDVLQRLENMCQESDGDLAESFHELGKRLFDIHLLDFVKFLSIHKESCLREKLILGISAEIAVYGKEERRKIINEERNKYLEIAKDKNLPPNLIEAINDIYREIKPEIFD